VVPVERTEGPGGEGAFVRVGERVRFAGPASPGQHVRRKSEDVRAGDVVLADGAVLGPAQIALAASAGHAALDVVRRPRVSVVSTGDELVEVEDAGRPDTIVNGNAHGIAALVEAAGGVARRLPIVPDDPAAIRAAMRDALTEDAVITIGGVSVGERDHVRAALADAGVELAFWRVAIRPGGPMAFGVSADGRPVFALPGNPVSAHVTFELFARPALRRMAGRARPFRRPLSVTLAEGVEADGRKALYLRARLSRAGEGWRAAWTGAQGSGILSGLAAADALVVIPAGAGPVPAGATAAALPLRDDLFDQEEP
jgi:molybdopterin molybdotransferase